MKVPQSLFYLGAALVLFGAGCVSPIKPQVIVPAPAAATRAYPGTVEVLVDGNIKSPNITVIDIPTFRAAICEAIQRDQVFRGGLVQAGGDHQLHVNFLSVEWPGPGTGMKTSFTSRWMLTRKADSALVMDEIIRGVHTSPLSDSVVGITRAMRSIEGAARITIADGLKALNNHVAP